MAIYYCCVVNCKNTAVNSEHKFYRFPKAWHKLKQREQWIAAVRRKHPDGSAWAPTPHDRICSEHFIGNSKADAEVSPSYVPSIFPPVYKKKSINPIAAINRHKRFMKRRALKEIQVNTVDQSVTTEGMEQEFYQTGMVNSDNTVNTDQESPINYSMKSPKTYADQQCQIEIILSDYVQPSNTFVCNRLIYSSHCEAEIQTDIIENISPIVIPAFKKFEDKKCDPSQTEHADKLVGPDTIITDDSNHKINFHGLETVHDNEQLVDLAGVMVDNFNFLLRRIDNKETDNCKLSIENKLFIFLIKMKTGLTFAALSVFFNVHRTTISRVFFSILQQLSCATADLVFWPSKGIVQATMPECFKPDYENTRVIIDCTEFRIEVPAGVDNRVLTYSHYKKGFTAKLLVGITPAGFISLKSKVAGGRKSDSQMTIDSGLLDKMDDGDVALADKGFPEFRKFINQQGKKVLVAMPPFLEKKTEFSKEETEETYNIARVRIHVERIMQRLRTYQILNKIPHNLFKYIDDIVHVCCVLVNLQPPII